jgi:uncharacterized membrane protein
MCAVVSTINESIEVGVPVRTAYDQWTQFEEFPKFMEGVESVTQIDDTRLHWVANIAGQRREWEAKITHQEPDTRIAWEAIEGIPNAGVVTFEPAGRDRARINLELDYDPETFVEKAGDFTGAIKARVKGDLQRFKDFIESRGHETGAWRGEIGGGATR